jgi:hypothetical protein
MHILSYSVFFSLVCIVPTVCFRNFKKYTVFDFKLTKLLNLQTLPYCVKYLRYTDIQKSKKNTVNIHVAFIFRNKHYSILQLMLQITPTSLLSRETRYSQFLLFSYISLKLTTLCPEIEINHDLKNTLMGLV